MIDFFCGTAIVYVNSVTNESLKIKKTKITKIEEKKMKNLKSIVATTVLVGTLAVNSFAGIIMTGADKQENTQPCSNEKTGIIMTGIIMTGIIMTGNIGIGIIGDVVSPDCSTKRTGVMMSD